MGPTLRRRSRRTRQGANDERREQECSGPPRERASGVEELFVAPGFRSSGREIGQPAVVTMRLISEILLFAQPDFTRAQPGVVRANCFPCAALVRRDLSAEMPFQKA